MWEETLNRFKDELQDCDNCVAYRNALERLEENPSNMALLKEYHRAEMQVQALLMQNITEGAAFDRFRSLSEALQTDPDAVAFLMAEYRLKKQMGDIFKTLTHATGLDLGPLE